MKKIICFILGIVFGFYFAFNEQTYNAVREQSKKIFLSGSSLTSDDVTVTPFTLEDFKTYEEEVGYLNPYMNSANFHGVTTFNGIIYGAYFLENNVNYNSIVSHLNSLRGQNFTFADLGYYDGTGALVDVYYPFTSINGVKTNLTETIFQINGAYATSINGEYGVLCTIKIPFNITTDFFDVNYFRYEILGDKNYISLLPPQLYLFNPFGHFLWDLTYFSYEPFTFNFEFSSNFAYDVKTVLTSFDWGLGDEDIFGDNFLNQNYDITTFFNNVEVYNTNQNNYRFLHTLSSPFKLRNFSFSLSLGQNLNSLEANIDYGLRFYVYNNYFNLFSLKNNIGGSVSSLLQDYVACEWYDIPCHLGNAVLYLLYDFPLTKPIVDFFKTLFEFITPLFDFLIKLTEIPYLSAIFFMFIFIGILFFIIK